MLLVLFFFFNDPATTEIYTLHIVGSVRCVQETGLNLQRPSTISISFGCISFKIPRCSNRNKFICRSLTPNIYEGIFLQHHIIRKYGRKLNCCIGLNRASNEQQNRKQIRDLPFHNSICLFSLYKTLDFTKIENARYNNGLQFDGIIILFVVYDTIKQKDK
eukprot:TRINITY_DN7782_c0_g1_i1.p2 TRINITY_DN7782_c0_g1~~TRINITY_DN7782_c0_g1_i1.p2  ORF type:complete len:161 (+),score=25.85 TRINITY_DN7782_c0_g1_i1:94-576(+)